MDELMYAVVLFLAGAFAWFASGVITTQQERIEWDEYVKEHKCVTSGDETIWKCELKTPHWILREKQ